MYHIFHICGILFSFFSSFSFFSCLSVLLFLLFSQFFPSCGACLLLFTLPCPAPLCFPSFPFHFSLPAGHVCLFSLSHAPLRSVFPLFLFTFPCPRGMFASFHSPMPRSALFSSFPLHFSLLAGHVCLFSLSHAPLRSAFPLFLFIFPCLRGMFASFLTLMPRSALFSQIASSVILVREPAPLYNTCIICGLLRATHSHNPGIIIWVIKPFRKSPC